MCVAQLAACATHKQAVIGDWRGTDWAAVDDGEAAAAAGPAPGGRPAPPGRRAEGRSQGVESAQVAKTNIEMFV